MSRFPAAFRLPAFASRSSDSRRGVGPSLRSADRTRSSGPRRGLPRSARTSYDRGGCLLYPEDGDTHPAGPSSPTGACRFAATSPCTPPQPSIDARLCFTRHQPGVHTSSPVRSSPRLTLPDGTGALGPGRPSALLRSAPLRTVRAGFPAHGSSKPRRLVGEQKCRVTAAGGIAPSVAVGVYETGFGLV